MSKKERKKLSKKQINRHDKRPKDSIKAKQIYYEKH